MEKKKENAYENWYLLERYQDFWEWYEDKYEQTRDELWDEFEKFEDERDAQAVWAVPPIA